jgi:hypothetical protein
MVFPSLFRQRRWNSARNQESWSRRDNAPRRRLKPRARFVPHLENLECRTAFSKGSSALAGAYGLLPLAFEANQGQTAAAVNFLAQGSGYTLFLTPQAAVLGLNRGSTEDVLRLQLVGANPQASVVGLDELATRSNYLLGRDPSQWHTDIPNYGEVEY